MILYFIRHADPDYYEDTITKKGKKQAKALAKYLQNLGINKIYSSPMGRAMDTMEYTASLVGIEPIIEDCLRELTDFWINRSPWGYIGVFDIPGETMRMDLKKNENNWYNIKYFKEINIKTEIKKLFLNIDEFIKKLGYEKREERYYPIEPNSDRIAIFSHKAISITIIGYLLGISAPLMWAGFWMPTSSISTILFEQRTRKWAVPRCIGFGDVPHLYKENLNGTEIINTCYLK